MKKIVLFLLALALPFSAFGVTEPVTPAKETPPMQPPPTALLGSWDLDLWGGSENHGGEIFRFDSVSLPVEIYDSSTNEDGAEWYFGSIKGHRGSQVTILRVPGQDELTLWVFNPSPSIGSFSGYYLEFETPLFITSPDEASGAMLGKFKHKDKDKTLTIYHSNVSLCRVGACKG